MYESSAVQSNLGNKVVVATNFLDTIAFLRDSSEP